MSNQGGEDENKHGGGKLRQEVDELKDKLHHSHLHDLKIKLINRK
jgi:hypothetical protein